MNEVFENPQIYLPILAKCLGIDFNKYQHVEIFTLLFRDYSIQMPKITHSNCYILLNLQLEIAQGATPGEEGELPGYNVSNGIPKTRHTTTGNRQRL